MIRSPAPPSTIARSSARTANGGALELTLLRPLAGLENQLVVGAAADLGDVEFTQETQPAEFTPERGTVATGEFVGETDVETANRAWGLYLTDTLSLTDRLALNVSGRFNRATVRIENRGDPEDDALDGDHTFTRFNPAAGVAWTPRRWLTAFVTYNEGMRVPTPMELTCADPTAPCKLPNNFLADPPLERVVSRTGEGRRPRADRRGGAAGAPRSSRPASPTTSSSSTTRPRAC